MPAVAMPVEVRPPATVAVAGPLVEADAPPRRRRPPAVRGEPARPPSAGRRLSSAVMLGVLSALLGLLAAAAIGIAALALFVFVRSAVG